MLQVQKKDRDRVIQVQRSGNALMVRTQRGLLQVEPKREDIVRVRYTRRAALTERLGIGMIRQASFANWDYEESESSILVTMAGLKLRIAKDESAITYYDGSNRLLLAERAHDPRELESFSVYRMVEDADAAVEEVVTADGVKKVVQEAKKVYDKDLYHTRLHVSFQPDEFLYGLGQAEEGMLNLRGTTQYLHQANRKIAVPFLLSTKGYGILFATGSPAVFQDTQYGSYFYTEADPEMDYYIIQGETMDRVIAGYRFLTGKAALLPRWAYGYVQSQERYETQDEILEVAREYRLRNLGLDALVLDWCSWEDGLWGQKTFDRERFPDVQAMMDALHKQGVHCMVSIWPNMDEKTPNYKEFAEKKLLLPNNNIYDAFRQEARELYWKQAQEGIFQYGTDAWWCDSSEPFTPEWAKIEKPEPGAMYQEFVETASSYMPAEYTNAYGLVHAQGIYQGQRGSGSEKRVMNLTRNGYTGQQRYGTVLWSGDIEASWQTLRNQIPAGLNFCAAGLPYWTLDIGAFFVKRGMPWYWTGDYEEGMEDLGYQELFTRWFQLGAFLPMFRSHGTDVRREMWAVDGPEHCFYNAVVTANQLRYRLMPYIYSMAGAVWREDASMLRMLAFDYASDPVACTVQNQFLFGTSLMVSPVTEPMYYGVHSTPIQHAKTRDVYLPQGNDWYDFYTGERYTGGQTIQVEASIDRIPLHVKAGSIIPTVEPGINAEDCAHKDIKVLVFSGRDASFSFYEDAGDGYGYEQGEYATTRLTWNEERQQLDIAEPQSPAGWKPTKHQFTVSCK